MNRRGTLIGIAVIAVVLLGALIAAAIQTTGSGAATAPAGAGNGQQTADAQTDGTASGVPVGCHGQRTPSCHGPDAEECPGHDGEDCPGPDSEDCPRHDGDTANGCHEDGNCPCVTK